MNGLDALSVSGLVDHAFCCRLTLTLLHFLWQGAALAGLSFAAAYALRKRSANLRYGLHAVLLAVMAACLPATYLWIDLPATGVARTPQSSPSFPSDPPSPQSAGDAISEPADTGTSFATSLPPEPHSFGGMLSTSEPVAEREAPATTSATPAGDSLWEQLVGRIAPYATAAYFAGLIGMMIRVLTALWGGHCLRASASPIKEPVLVDLIHGQARRIGLKAGPLVAWCGRVTTPVVIGILKPAILLPACLASGLAPDQLAALLTHELAHIRRYDLAVNLLQRIIEAVLFFHPAAWYVSRQISRERENCCDDLVLRAGWRRMDYAEALLKTAEVCSGGRLYPAAVGVSAGRASDLKRRILRLLAATQEPPVRLSRAGAVAVAAAFVAAIVALVAIHDGLVAQTNPAVAAGSDSITLAAAEPTTEIAAPVRHLADLVRRVRRNEALLRDLDVTVRTVATFAAGDGASTERFSSGPPQQSATEKTYRAVTQGDRFRFSGEDAISLASGERLCGKRLCVFDGVQTVSIEEGNCVTIHQGRYEPAQLFPPHCWGIFHLEVNFPLSVYLEGTEAMKSCPKARRLAGKQRSSFNTVESRLVGEEVIDGLACVKVDVRRRYYNSSGPLAVQRLWLAKGRNFHVARCRTAWMRNDEEVPSDETRVTKWRELSKGVWLPEVVEWKDVSPRKRPWGLVTRRLVVEKAAWRPRLPEGFFKVPEIPAGLPKYVIGAKGRLVEGPHQPVPVKNAVATTLQAILKRLADEEKRYDRFDIVTRTRYEMLNRSELNSGGAYARSTKRERSILAGDRRYYEEDLEAKLAGGATSSNLRRQAYDGRWLREVNRFSSSVTSGGKPRVRAGLRLGGPDELLLVRAHNILFRDGLRSRQSVAEFLDSRSFDKENLIRMTVEYAGDEMVGDLYCHKLKCGLPLRESKAPHPAFVIWLARDRNLLVVRHEWQDPGRSRKLPTSVSYVDDLREIRPGLWFPFRATWLAHQTESGDGLAADNIILQWRQDMQVERLSLKPKVSDDLFGAVEVPEGTEIAVRNEQGEQVGRFKQLKTGNLELSVEKLRGMERACAANEDDHEDPKDPTAPERTTRIAAALKVLRRHPPATQDERVEASLEILRNYRVFKTNAKKWGLAIRVLIEIGKPAVPRLIRELDETDHLANRGYTLRALGFVLRGIGDPRAVPALIRAVPYTLQPPYSDCGIGIQCNPELLRFLQRHDNAHTEFGRSFSFGRPINEILPALQKLTGEKAIVPGEKDDQEFKNIHHIFLGGDAKELRANQTLFLRFAERWSDWWSKNWQKHVKDKADAQLDLTRQSLARYARSISAVSPEDGQSHQGSQPAKPETLKPVSMSAEEFLQLSTAEQRALLVRVFQRRIEHSKNLHYEAEQTFLTYENLNGQPGKLRGERNGYRQHFRYWRLGDSYRLDTESRYSLKGAARVNRESIAVNGEEGVGRVASLYSDRKIAPHGQVNYPYDPGIRLNGYLRWLNRVYDPPRQGQEEYLFPSLIAQIREFQIEAAPVGDLVQLSRPIHLSWAAMGKGKQVYLLNPRKGFLPIRFESRWDAVPASGNGPPQWQSETFVVGDSRLVGDVWMPVNLTQTLAFSASPDRMSVFETTVSRIEHGTVTPADIKVEFTEGMQIVDTIVGVSYTADAHGNPAGPVKLEPGWKHKPPEWWTKRYGAAGSTHAQGGAAAGTSAGGKAVIGFSMATRLSAEDKRMLEADRRKEEDYDKRMAALLKVLQSGPPVTLDQRIDAGVEALRIYQLGRQNDERPWASVVRELIRIGKPAVPKLTAELDRTDREMTLRALGFVLRGIGDPRAIPALIRAIPRTLQPSSSDYGLLIEDDPELAQFMREHDHDHKPGTPAAGSGYFSYGRPIREIMPALDRMTGQSFDWMELNFVFLDGGESQQRIKRGLYLKLAERWADWWSKNWHKYLSDEVDAQLDLTRRTLDRWAGSTAAASDKPPRAEFPCGLKVTVGEGSIDQFIQSFDESPSNAFLDLDTGRHPTPPEGLIKRVAGPKPSAELLAWAEREGVDLINIKIAPPGSDKIFYAFQPVGMRVWRIENSRYDNLQKELRVSKRLVLPAPWKGPLAQIDEKSGRYDDKLTVSFLFITKEGTCGAIQVQPPVTRKLVPGTPSSPSGGLHYQFIYESSPARAKASPAAGPLHRPRSLSQRAYSTGDYGPEMALR